MSGQEGTGNIPHKEEDTDKDPVALEYKLIFDDPPDIAVPEDLPLNHPYNFVPWQTTQHDIERRNIAGLSPLAAAVKQGNVEEAKLLIEAGARAGIYGPKFGSLPHLAVKLYYELIHKIFPLLKLSIEAGADPNAPGPEPDCESLLCMVIRTLFLPKYRQAISRYLIEKGGVDVNTRSRSGTYPIILAAETEDKPLVHYLIRQGANVEVFNDQGMRAVHYAILSGPQKCIGPLIKAGADLQPRDNFGRTPLHISASRDQWEFLAIFLDFLPQGFDINVRDDDGWTPLMWACKRWACQISTIEVLVQKHGADIWAVSYDGKWSALKLANYADASDGVRQLLQPPEGERERIMEDGTKQIWDPSFHDIAPGDYHRFNSCSFCGTLGAGTLYKCITCEKKFLLCWKCFPNRSRIHYASHEMEIYVEPEESDCSSADEDGP